MIFTEQQMIFTEQQMIFTEQQMIFTEQQTALLEFVKAAHGEQKRKYTGEPYWHHLVNVAEIVHRAEPNSPCYLVEIALCHDLYEDTNVTPAELKSFLTETGYSAPARVTIRMGVENLTDVMVSEKYPEMNRKERKTWEARRLGKIDAPFQTVKYADLIDNSATITLYDPAFAKVYIAEKKELINRMRLGNLDLLMECYNIVKQYERNVESSIAGS